MKKFGKFVFGVLSVAAFAGSAYYLVKNVLNKDSSDDFDDFEDEFDDFDFNDEGEADIPSSAPENREYVTLNINADADDSEEAPEEAAEETPVEAEPAKEPEEPATEA